MQFRTKDEVTSAGDGVFLHHLIPSSKTLAVMQKSLGRAWLCLHEHKVWCNRNKPAEPNRGTAADVHACLCSGAFTGN